MTYPEISDWTTFQIELAAHIFVQMAPDAASVNEAALFSIRAANTFAQHALEAFDLGLPNDPK